MGNYRHHVSGFFTLQEAAENTRLTLIDSGFLAERIHIFSADANSSSPAPEGKSDAALKDILVDGTIGSVVGTGIGVLGSIALTSASVTLFIASPLVAPLVLIGWGASLGGFIGASIGASAATSEDKEGWLSDLIGDAIASGQVVLVLETLNEQETITAGEIIKDSVGVYEDTDVSKSANNTAIRRPPALN